MVHIVVLSLCHRWWEATIQKHSWPVQCGRRQLRACSRTKMWLHLGVLLSELYQCSTCYLAVGRAIRLLSPSLPRPPLPKDGRVELRSCAPQLRKRYAAALLQESVRFQVVVSGRCLAAVDDNDKVLATAEPFFAVVVATRYVRVTENRSAAHQQALDSR